MVATGTSTSAASLRRTLRRGLDGLAASAAFAGERLDGERIALISGLAARIRSPSTPYCGVFSGLGCSIEARPSMLGVPGAAAAAEKRWRIELSAAGVCGTAGSDAALSVTGRSGLD